MNTLHLTGKITAKPLRSQSSLNHRKTKKELVEIL